MAERVGFEPTYRLLTDNSISSRARYGQLRYLSARRRRFLYRKNPVRASPFSLDAAGRIWHTSSPARFRVPSSAGVLPVPFPSSRHMVMIRLSALGDVALTTGAYLHRADAGVLCSAFFPPSRRARGRGPEDGRSARRTPAPPVQGPGRPLPGRALGGPARHPAHPPAVFVLERHGVPLPQVRPDATSFPALRGTFRSRAASGPQCSGTVCRRAGPAPAPGVRQGRAESFSGRERR